MHDSALQAERRLAALVESSRDAIISTDLHGIATSWNPAAEALFGYTAREMLGKSTSVLVPPDRRDEARKLFDQAARGEILEPVETVRVAKDGRHLHVELQLSPLRDNDRSPSGVSSIVRDLTKWMNAQESLRVQEAVLRSFHDRAPMMTGVVELLDDDIVHVSGDPDAERCLGLRPEASGPLRGGDPGTSREILDEWIRRSRESGGLGDPVRFEYLHTMGGMKKTLSVTVCPVVSACGEPARPRFAYVAEDVTDARRLEQQVRQSHRMEAVGLLAGGVAHDFNKPKNRTLVGRLEERLRVQSEALSASQRRTQGVLDSIADPLLIVNREFTILAANEGAATWSGVSARQLVGRKCYREFARNEICPGCPVLATFGTGRPASVSMGWEERGGAGERRDVEVCSFPLAVSGAGAIGEAVEHIRDVTEYRQAREELLALRAQRDQDDAMRAIGRLAGGIAHDFNNQLTVIKGCVQFLLEAMPADAPGREDAERISATGDRGAALVRQLLAFCRKQKSEFRPLRLPDLVNEMAAMTRPLLGEQTLIRVRAAPGLWLVRGDPAQIEQMIMNLVVNARDAMIPPGERFPAGTLTAEMANVELEEAAFRPTVESVVPGRYVMLAVSDTGSGMTPEVKRQIFEPYFTTKEPGSGTGLGLSMVFGIVKQHRGYIFFDSELGQGSTFRVYLPCAGDEEEASDEVPAATAPPEWPRGETMTALVAEDDWDVREIVRRGLEASGYRVYTAGGVEEALAMVATLAGPIHLLVADMAMPGGSGQALAERLLATFPAVKTLFISAYFDDTLADPPVPGALFLQKPFSPEDLARKAREVLGEGAPGRPGLASSLPSSLGG